MCNINNNKNNSDFPEENTDESRTDESASEGNTNTGPNVAAEGTSIENTCTDYIITPTVLPPKPPPVEEYSNVIAPPEPASRELKIYSMCEFLKLNLPPREFIVDPIIPTQGITMLYASRGVGKTFLALSLAISVSIRKPVFKWDIPKPRKVLYIDGEMSPQTMQERLNGIIRGMENAMEHTNEKELIILTTDNLKILCITQQDISLDLSDEEDQDLLEPYLKDVELIIIDNLSTLTRVKENDADSWLDMQKWLIKLRQKNISVLLVHHAGKGGTQRGTSRKEDILDTVIALKKPSDYEAEEGAKFEVRFEKSRGFAGEKAKPFEVELYGNIEEGFTWLFKDGEAALQDRVNEMVKNGMSERDIAQELGITKSKVHRIKNKRINK